MSGSNAGYVDEMYEAWARDPTSVHASWDAYFRGINYTPPPSLGMHAFRLKSKQTAEWNEFDLILIVHSSLNMEK